MLYRQTSSKYYNVNSHGVGNIFLYAYAQLAMHVEYFLCSQTPEEVSIADQGSDNNTEQLIPSQPANPESTDDEIMKLLGQSRKERMAHFMSADTGDFPELERNRPRLQKTKYACS